MAIPYVYTNIEGTQPYPVQDVILANKLFAHQAADITSGAYFVKGEVKPWHNIAVNATNWGGASVAFEWSLDGVSNWTTFIDNQGQETVYTQNTLRVIVALRNIWIRARLFNTTGTTDNVTATFS